MQTSKKATILLVDDAPESRILAKWFFSTFGYTVHSAASAEEALACFDPALHSLVLTDNCMPGMNGAEMALIIKGKSPSTPIVMFSGNPPSNPAGVDVVIQKPQHLLSVKETMDALLASPRAQAVCAALP